MSDKTGINWTDAPLDSVEVHYAGNFTGDPAAVPNPYDRSLPAWEQIPLEREHQKLPVILPAKVVKL